MGLRLKSSSLLLLAALLIPPACTKKSSSGTAEEEETEPVPGQPGKRRKKQPPPAEQDQKDTEEPVRGHTPFNPNAPYIPPKGHDWQDYPLPKPKVEPKEPGSYPTPPHMKGAGAGGASGAPPPSTQPPGQGNVPATANAAAAEAPKGDQVFMRACAACHGPEGTGEQMRRIIPTIADLTRPEIQNKIDDRGMEELIAKGRGKMPPFEGALTPEQIKAVVKHVRTLKK